MLKEHKIPRKTQIERKATELFKNRGYAATSMRDLANDLGIEAASLYSHIKSKEEILQRICFQMAEEFFRARDNIQSISGSATEKLHKAIISHIQVTTKNMDASVVFFHEWKHLSQPYLKDFLEMRSIYEEWFVSIIEEGVKSGEFKNMDCKFAMLTLLSSLNWLPNWYRPDGKMELKEIQEQMAAFLISGIKK